MPLPVILTILAVLGILILALAFVFNAVFPSEPDRRSVQGTVLSSRGGRPGETIGKYEIVGEIGEGGMGKILKGRSPEGAVVAVKVMSQWALERQPLVDRFLREMEIARALDHPNIAKVLDYGDEEGSYYFVMEYVEGCGLRDLIEDGPTDLQKTIDIVRQTCEGLAHAHANGVIHRDIKPENLLVAKDGAVKIVDFGIARPDREEGRFKALTMTNVVMGSPSYMSPEQRKDAKHVDERADIYSLGVVLYEMVSGQLPTGLLRLDLIPEDLQAIIEKSIAFNPEHRYRSVGELLSAIKAYKDKGRITTDEHALEEVGDNARLRELMIDTLYPKATPKLDDCDLASFYLPAVAIGGNYYDFIPVDANRHGVLVGNVFEKPNVQSAIFLTMIRSVFRVFAFEEPDPGAVLTRTNDAISRERLDQFAIFSYFIIDAKERRLSLATAGYRPLGIFRAAAKEFEYVQTKGVGIGIMEGAEYEGLSVQLDPGDIVTVCSYGVLETKSLAGETFGQDRFEAAIRDHSDQPGEHIAGAIRKAVMRFSAGVAQGDDMTVVVAKIP